LPFPRHHQASDRDRGDAVLEPLEPVAEPRPHGPPRGGKFDSGTPASWNEGDFDYDGVVDIIDVADFLSTGLFNAGPYNPPSTGGDIAAVPEPAAATMIAAGVVLAAILRRSRMRCTLWHAWA
jgi:hypothetical protein